jgi:3-hydroxyisobutyrate dehydrogenase-like beta-hydroxyacid dehydrogenase
MAARSLCAARLLRYDVSCTGTCRNLTAQQQHMDSTHLRSSISSWPFFYKRRKQRVQRPTNLSRMSAAESATLEGAIGFVGLGIMGEGMAARLLSEGIAGSTPDKPLIVWNRTPSKCTALQERFPDKTILVKSTAREVVQSCAITYSMLSTPQAARAVFEAADDGVLAGVSTGKSIVDCATLAEADMQRMSAAVCLAGGSFLEAPVSGSKVPAAAGALIFLCAGSQELFAKVRDNGLNVMGKASHYFGDEVGAGTRAKLVVNSLMGTMLAAFGEGLALSQAVGLDPAVMIEVISQGAVACPVFALKGPKMIAGDHAPHFPLKHAAKDMTLAKEMAAQAGVEYSVMNQAESLLRAAREDHDLQLADDDFSAVFEKIHKESTSEYSRKRLEKK